MNTQEASQSTSRFLSWRVIGVAGALLVVATAAFSPSTVARWRSRAALALRLCQVVSRAASVETSQPASSPS